MDLRDFHMWTSYMKNLPQTAQIYFGAECFLWTSAEVKGVCIEKYFHYLY